MRILIADKIATNAIERLTREGFVVEHKPDLDADNLGEAIENFEVLVVRSTKVTAAALAKANNLQLIVRAGAGYNTIDVNAAANRGIFVANCPGKNAIAVAELTWGLILALDRRIPDNVSTLRGGQWDKAGLSQSRGLFGATLGLVGFGEIAHEVAHRAQAFGMSVCAWSRSLTNERAQQKTVTACSSLVEVFERSDVVSLHLPLTDDTRELVDAQCLGAMKPGALLVNTSRAEIVNPKALNQILSTGQIRVASDVFDDEPSASRAAFSPSVAAFDSFYGTHHIGGATEQAQQAVADEVVRIVTLYGRRGETTAVVNLAESSEAAGQILVRHLDRVGVLASVLNLLSQSELNVQDMQNIIFAGGDAACAKITVSDVPSQALLERIRNEAPHVIGVSWLPN